MRYLLVLLLATALGACALTTDQIDVPYQSAGSAPAVAGAGDVRIAVTAKDGRTAYRDRVSSKKNGFGMEMAPIVASNDVVQTVGQAIQSELAARGFAVGDGGAEVSVEVVRFYNDFGIGVVTGNALAEVTFRVVVRRRDGSSAYSRQYTGVGREDGIMFFLGDNARPPLISALTDSVRQVANDPSLIAALLAVGRPASAGAEAPGKPTS